MKYLFAAYLNEILPPESAPMFMFSAVPTAGGKDHRIS
jgi:hypothetical protein